MAINTGVNVTKANAYAVLSVPSGVGVVKANAYAVLGAPAGVAVVKANVYATLYTGNYNGPVWNINSMPDATLDTPYSLSWAMANSASPVTYAVTSGSLPPGLSLSTGAGGTNPGSISGTPTLAGSYSFTLTGTNSYGHASQTFTLNVDKPSTTASAPVITSSALGYAVVNVAYSNTLTIQGGTSPYVLTVVNGSLPPGISLSGLTLSGTPTSEGVFNFTLQVTDANGSSTTQSCQLPVIAPAGNFSWAS